MKKGLLLVIAVLLINGCATQTPYQTRTGPVGALMVQADQHSVNGEHDQAIALLERAVRIEPRNGHAWLHLAKLHFASGELNKAEQFSRRAMQFAAADKTLKRECQALIDKVRRQANIAG